jgi:hypothetical protein
MSRPFSPNLDNTQFALELEKDSASSSPHKTQARYEWREMVLSDIAAARPGKKTLKTNSPGS